MKKYYGFFRGESYSPAYMTKEEWDRFNDFLPTSKLRHIGDIMDEFCDTILKNYRSSVPKDGIEVKSIEEL